MCLLFGTALRNGFTLEVQVQLLPSMRDCDAKRSAGLSRFYFLPFSAHAEARHLAPNRRGQHEVRNGCSFQGSCRKQDHEPLRRSYRTPHQQPRTKNTRLSVGHSLYREHLWVPKNETNCMSNQASATSQ